MQITIKNIWNIKEASVNLSWLSVIAWSNDSWKSTVSKLVFSVIKAFQRYKFDFNISKEEVLEDYIWKLYRFLRFAIRNEDKNDKSLTNLDLLLREDFYPPVFLNELSAFWGMDIFENKKNKILNLKINKEDKNSMLHSLENIKTEFLKEEKKEDLIKTALKNILQNEFENQLNNERLWKKWIIEINELESLLIRIVIEDDKISEVKIFDDILKIKDTTFIDSPIILNLFNYSIDNSNISSRRNKELQFHIKDLFSKIRNSKFDKEKENFFIKKLEKITWWTFQIKRRDLQDVLIFKKWWYDIDPINTATWIKSFWLLDLLDKSNSLESSDLLILDEPEVHLHPEWQVKYAELIIYLIKERDLSVLITSHSPYLIEALDKFSREKWLDNRANFYLSSELKKWEYIIENKTDDKNAIFEKLSEPFEKLVWG